MADIVKDHVQRLCEALDSTAQAIREFNKSHGRRGVVRVERSLWPLNDGSVLGSEVIEKLIEMIGLEMQYYQMPNMKIMWTSESEKP